MIVLDENFPESQRQRLREWRIAVRQIGLDVGRSGMKDDEIVPLLISLPRPTFFTLDRDFYAWSLCNRHYCLVTAAVSDDRAAEYVRRLLKHVQFRTASSRMGLVLKISPSSIRCWRGHVSEDEQFSW